MSTATGYAIMDGNFIRVETVSPTRRAALVNWLVVEGFVVSSNATNDDIEAVWEANKPSWVKVVQVSIKVVE